MGKDLKGRECGKGICQIANKKYVARFTDRTGKRQEKRFDKLPEARNWLDEAKYQDRHGNISAPSGMTVDAWFDYWIENIVGSLTHGSIRVYTTRYTHNIKPVIGRMLLKDVRQLHCQQVLNEMTDDYSGATIRLTYVTMGSFFKSALENDLILKHPMSGVKLPKTTHSINDIKYMEIDEQRKFLAVAKGTRAYNQFVFLLETGLRTGELIGLTWNNIDFENRTLTVDKSLRFDYKTKEWRASPPKTITSYRTIPLTKRAYAILKSLYDGKNTRKESETLARVLTFSDRRTDETRSMNMKDLVFISNENGEPIKNDSYNLDIETLCKKANIQHFSMHSLRHTYATRAIEMNVQPKVLQKLLGHSSLKTTMDIYVHVTDDSLLKAVEQFETFQIDD